MWEKLQSCARNPYQHKVSGLYRWVGVVPYSTSMQPLPSPGKPCRPLSLPHCPRTATQPRQLGSAKRQACRVDALSPQQHRGCSVGFQKFCNPGLHALVLH